MSQTTVLIADDEMEFASTLAERLRIRGYNAKSVYCAEDAIAFVRDNSPDVMLLDLRMPRMNGIQVLKTIRQFNESIQVILLTGLGDSQERTEGIESGAFDFMMKPMDIEKIIMKINEAKNIKSEKEV